MRISDWSADVCSSDLVAHTLPEATLCFMHPVKPEEAIAEAYHQHGVRIFSLDTMEELEKIMRATNDAEDLYLCVRLRVSSEYAELSLASKFGVHPEEARELLIATDRKSTRLNSSH